MATVAMTIGTTWTLVAVPADEQVSVQCTEDVVWYCAAVATETAPTVAGHSLQGPDHAATRENIGNRFLYAKAASGSRAFAVTK